MMRGTGVLNVFDFNINIIMKYRIFIVNEILNHITATPRKSR